MDNPNLKMLWDWFEDKINTQEFVVSKRAYKQIKEKTSDEFFEWFKGITVINDTTEDLSNVQKIKDLLEIEEDSYGKGVDENDLFIIVIAKRINSILVTEEKIQVRFKLPRNNSSYKIPAVCNLLEVNVDCINFTALLNRDH